MREEKEGFFSIFRIKYFSCQSHEGQVLNYICVDKKCKSIGLLCSLCKSQHKEHTIFPLKVFLKKIQKNNEQPLSSSESFQLPLQQLQQQHQKVLYNLKQSVEKMAEHIRSLEIHINDQYSKAKIELLEQVQMNMKLKSFLEDALNSKIKDRDAFKSDIERIASMVQINQNTKDPYFATNLGKISQGFKSMRFSIQKKLKSLLQFIEEENFKAEQFHQRLKVIEQVPTNCHYTFSQQFKAKNITVNSKKRQAKQNKSGEGRFVLVNQKIGVKRQKISFRITLLKNWVGIGISLRKKIKQLNYKFEYNNIGHGSYLISSNGYTWSHSDKDKNVATCEFKFVEGDIIDVQLQPGLLTFINRRNKQKQTLQICSIKQEVEQFCFAVNLCSQGDMIEIYDGK